MAPVIDPKKEDEVLAGLLDGVMFFASQGHQPKPYSNTCSWCRTYSSIQNALDVYRKRSENMVASPVTLEVKDKADDGITDANAD